MHSARMSGYWCFSISNACGTTLTCHVPIGEFLLALKHRLKYPGCFGLMQNMYTERVGFASEYAVRNFSAP